MLPAKMLTLILLGCIAVARCAPTEQLLARAAAPAQEARLQEGDLKPLHPLREYLILTPDAQLQLQPALKLQQPVVQPLALYGTASSTRQFENICNQIQQGVGTFQEVIPFPLPWFETSGDEKSKKITAEQQKIPEINTDAETIPQGMLPRTPVVAAPTPEHRFYTIAGQPQFFGNVDILQNPLHPIFSLQPLQAIKQRSIADPAGAIERDDKNPILLVQSSESLPLALPLQGSEAVRQEQLLADDNVARQFVKALEEKQQAVQAAADDAAQKFASRFDADQSIELKKEDVPAVGLESASLPLFVPAAKSVESLEAAEENQELNASNVENADLVLQQTKLAQEEDKPEAA